jgi:protein-S-isoprenylcysteine O-methyltransferase Ste14
MTTHDGLFRGLVVVVLGGMLVMSAVFRWRARRTTGTIPRLREGMPILLARLLFAVPLYGGFLAYAIHPAWLAWSQAHWPAGVRESAAVLGLASLPLMYWVLHSIGPNISETTLTKPGHELVTGGPYRLVRHPLYSVATIALVASSVMASNGLLLAMAVMVPFLVLRFVVPKEEAQLIHRFGNRYVQYQQRTGRFLPRLIRPRRLLPDRS